MGNSVARFLGYVIQEDKGRAEWIIKTISSIEMLEGIIIIDIKYGLQRTT